MVNATLTVPAWVEVEAENEAEALNEARQQRPQDYNTDMGSAEVEFNVDPAVSELPF